MSIRYGDYIRNRPRVGSMSTRRLVPLTSNLKWARAPGNVQLSAAATNLPKDSVANVSLVVALDKLQLVERIGKIPRRQFELVLAGIDVILGR
jgi:mRNA interferase MazF